MPVSVITQHNDNGRSGANLQETALNTSTVNRRGFGRVFRRRVIGSVYAQPLLVTGVDVPHAGTRNVLYVATMHNLVYAFDAEDPDASTPLWGPVSLGPPIPLPDAEIGPSLRYRDISVEVGVVSTPVISISQNALYAVAATKEAGAYHHRLHALDLATGKEILGGPVTIEATVSGTGDGSTTGPGGAKVIPFRSDRQIQRSALLLLDGKVFVAFAAYGDRGPYHGWVFAYDARDLHRVGVYNTTPTGGGGGIWQAGQGPTSDGRGVFVLTGNGTSIPGSDLSCAFIRIDPRSVSMDQWFAPKDWEELDKADVDLGSGGALVLPGTDLLVGGGKDGRLFLLRRNGLGNAADDAKAVQVFQASMAQHTGHPAPASDGYHHIHGSPVYWEGPMGKWIYIGAEADFLRAYAFDGATFRTTPASESSFTTPPASMPGAILSISANGAEPGSGILWASMPVEQNSNQQVVDGVLYAFDASDLRRVLWSSRQDVRRDDVGSFPKFCPPTVVNARVYLPTFCGPAAKVTLPEMASGGPALANAGDGSLVLAWTGTDLEHHLNVATSPEGRFFGHKVTLDETSLHGPAAAFGDGRLFLAWTGTGGEGHLNVTSSSDRQTFTEKETLSATSPSGPALAHGGGRLFLAWTGADHRINVMSSADGVTFQDLVILDQTSSTGPGLAFAGGVLYLTWVGIGGGQSLNLMRSVDGRTWTDKVTLQESSERRPALAELEGTLHLVWTGRDLIQRLNLLVSEPGTTKLRAKQTYGDTSAAAPALVAYDDDLYVAWTGSDGERHINVARLSAGHVTAYGLLSNGG